MTVKIFRDLNEYTLVSSIKKEDIDMVKKYRPAALKKKDADGNDIFAVSYVEGRPCVAANGITFGATSAEGGYAMIAGEIPTDLPANTTASDYVADKISAALAFIGEFEKSIPETVAAIKSDRAKVIEGISVV